MLSHIFKRISFLFILISFLFPISVNAKISPSFDCKKASTEVEKLICSNEELAKLDVEMNKSYKAFMDSLEEEYYQKKLKRKQRDWLGYRKTVSCFNENDEKKTKCLTNMYQVRVKNLNAWTKRENYSFFENLDELENIGMFISKKGEEYYYDCFKRGGGYPSITEDENIRIYDDRMSTDYYSVVKDIRNINNNIYILCETVGGVAHEFSLDLFDDASPWCRRPVPRRNTSGFYCDSIYIFKKLKEKFINSLKNDSFEISNLLESNYKKKNEVNLYQDLRENIDKIEFILPQYVSSYEELKNKFGYSNLLETRIKGDFYYYPLSDDKAIISGITGEFFGGDGLRKKYSNFVISKEGGYYEFYKDGYSINELEIPHVFLVMKFNKQYFYIVTDGMLYYRIKLYSFADDFGNIL